MKTIMKTKTNSLAHDFPTAHATHSEPPCLSLYQPTHRHHPCNQQSGCSQNWILEVPLIWKPIKNAWKAAGGALVVLLTTAAVLGSPLAHGTPVEKMKPSVLAAEVGKDEKPSRPPERLYGTWTAKDVDAKMGEVKIRLTFRQEMKATLLAWSDIPFAGQVRDLKGAFSVHRDTISSEAIRDGKKAKFSFENEQLVLRFISGKVIRFDRE